MLNCWWSWLGCDLKLASVDVLENVMQMTWGKWSGQLRQDDCHGNESEDGEDLELGVVVVDPLDVGEEKLETGVMEDHVAADVVDEPAARDAEASTLVH